MESVVTDHIRASLRSVAHAKNMLVFVVGKSCAGKTTILQSIAQSFSMTYMPLGGALSRRLLDVSAPMRPLQLESLTHEMLLPANPAGFCIDNTELLFDPLLQCDPIRFALHMSSLRLILFSLNGSYEGRRFTHGARNHPEYVSVDLQNVPVITISNQQIQFHEN